MTHSDTLLSRSERLKQSTHDLHEKIDTTIMTKHPFESTENYLRFLSLQFYFLRDVEVLYTHPALLECIDDLPMRSRIRLLEQDFFDLGYPLPSGRLEPVLSDTTELARALGWLYVVEGSKVGAAMLGQQVQKKLSLNGEYGARFLAGPGAGRGSAWRHLVHLIDNIELDAYQEEAIVFGARQAFTRFQLYQAQVYSG